MARLAEVRLALLLTAACVMLCACSRTDPDADSVLRVDLLAFSTTVSFSVFAPPANFQQTVVPALEQRMHILETRWRSFGEGSLGTLNQSLETGGCATTDAQTLELIKTALEHQRESGGLFDPTLGIEVDAWGFRDFDQKEKRPLPRAKGTLSVNGNTLCADGPLRIDLGGIAKGAIVLELARVLASFNVDNAIINVGGDLLVLGRRGDGPWRVAIQHPRGRGVIATIEAASGDAIFSSGDYHRRIVVDGQVTHHILDPRTQAPSTGAIATTVIHSDPVLADAAATALLVAGSREFPVVARRLGITRAILINEDLTVHQLEGTGVELPTQLPDTP